ncbi:alpha/beta hydrolase [Flavimarina sp. Hel_I_48]|uniref:alpha/beta hydrolase n=1 Tax=Flavimarina sp. Hel_I_48 TaxID=1392488 RepID=UPI0006904FB5|nr:alpha/beta hydrolase [Flavimarina sp. Hel_I_48]
MRSSFKKIIAKLLGGYINLLAYIAPDKAAGKVFSLFSTPRQGKIRTHHTDFLNPARHERIPFKNMELQVYIWPGEGETVLLVHGWESNTHRYKMLIKELQQKNYRIIAFDAPGHGYSEGFSLYVPLYDEAMQLIKEKYEPTYIVGHSIGAMTAIHNQSKHPDTHVKRMVILGAPDKLEDMLADSEKLLGLSNRTTQVMDAYFKKRFGFIKKEFSSAALAKKIQIPGLIIHDKDDSITPSYGSKAIHNNWPKSTLVYTTGLNHSLYGEAVDKVILKFLQGEKIPSEDIVVQSASLA